MFLQLLEAHQLNCHMFVKCNDRRAFICIAYMAADTFYDEISVFRVWWRHLGLYMILPEFMFEENHFLLIGKVPFQLTDNYLIQVVPVKTAVENPVNVHDRHIMPPLRFVIGRDNFLFIRPPLVPGIIIRGL